MCTSLSLSISLYLYIYIYIYICLSTSISICLSAASPAISNMIMIGSHRVFPTTHDDSHTGIGLTAKTYNYTKQTNLSI